MMSLTAHHYSRPPTTILTPPWLSYNTATLNCCRVSFTTQTLAVASRSSLHRSLWLLFLLGRPYCPTSGGENSPRPQIEQ